MVSVNAETRIERVVGRGGGHRVYTTLRATRAATSSSFEVAVPRSVQSSKTKAVGSPFCGGRGGGGGARWDGGGPGCAPLPRPVKPSHLFVKIAGDG